MPSLLGLIRSVCIMYVEVVSNVYCKKYFGFTCVCHVYYMFMSCLLHHDILSHVDNMFNYADDYVILA